MKFGVDNQSGLRTPLFGFHLTYLWKKKWSIEGAIQYKYRTNEQNNAFRLMVVNIDTLYGPQTNNQSINNETINDLYFIEAPLVLKYRLLPRLDILAGPQIGLVFNESSRWSGTLGLNDTYDVDESLGSDGFSSPGIVRFDLGLISGASYRLSPKWRVDLRYVQGLIDLTADEYFGNNNNYLNQSLQLSLKWYW